MNIKAELKNGWYVCSGCGRKLARFVDNDTIEIKCRDSKCACLNTIQSRKCQFKTEMFKSACRKHCEETH